MSLEDLIRRRATEGCRQVVLSATRLGWQASLLRPGGAAYRVESAADPVEALWNVLCDLPERRDTGEDDLIG